MLVKAVGGVPSPFDCYLLWRGLKTLQVRMERHMQNAHAVASALMRHPLVRCVNYPGESGAPARVPAGLEHCCFAPIGFADGITVLLYFSDLNHYA